MTHPFDEPPPVSRRVVVTVGLTGLALAAPAGIRRLPDLLGLDARAKPDDLTLTRSSFAPYVGASVVLRSGDTRARAVLVEIEDLSDDLAGDENSFLVRFRSETALEQDVYEVANDAFTTPALLLVPSAAHKAGTLSAVFNRTTEEF